MATKDIVTDALTTHSYTGTSDGAGANSIDNDVSTYQGLASTGNNSDLSVISQHTWVTPILITSVSFMVYVQAIYHAEYECFQCSVQYFVQYLPSGGTWTTFSNGNATNYKNSTTSQHGGHFYTFNNSFSTGLVSFSEIHDNVVGIRVVAYANVHGTGGGGSYGYQYARVYEIHALTEKLVNSGICIAKAGGTVVNIGCLDLQSTYKLRVCTPTGVKGIPLVALSAANASGARIKDASTVKALPVADV